MWPKPTSRVFRTANKDGPIVARTENSQQRRRDTGPRLNMFEVWRRRREALSKPLTKGVSCHLPFRDGQIGDCPGVPLLCLLGLMRLADGDRIPIPS